MRILIATDWYAPVINGVVTSVLNLENALRAQGHEVRILTLSPNVHSHEDEHTYYLRSLSVNRIYPNARISYSYARSYLKDIVAWKPEVIHTQCEFSSFSNAIRIAKRLNIPIVHTYHTVYEDYTHYFAPTASIGKGIAVTWSRQIAKRVGRMIVPTEKVRGMLEGYNIDTPIDVIPSGIDLSRFYKKCSQEQIRLEKEKLGIPLTDILCVSLGRLAKEKNVTELLEFFKKTRPENCTYLVAGDGPYRENLEKQAEEMGIAHKVIFCGMVKPENVPLYYQMGDIFLCASKSETQGITYIEAMASGVPVICRMDDCLKNVVEHGVNGMVYQNYWEFKEAFEKLIDDREYADMLSVKAKEKTEEYSIENFAEKVFKSYQMAISQHNKKEERILTSEKHRKIRLLHRGVEKE